MAGRYLEAIEILDSAPKPVALSSGGDRASSVRGALREARARVLTDAGDFDAAWRLAETFEPPRGERGVSEQVLLGELQCARKHPAEGRLEIAGVLRSPDLVEEFEFSPELARIRAVAGLCALKAGDRVSAKAFAAQARAAFTEQPGVSDYYKRPLAELDAALR